MSKYEPMHIKILKDENSSAPAKEWIFNYSDNIVFTSLLTFNNLFNWVDKQKLTRLANHMYGIQTKPVACAVSEFIDTDDLEVLSECIIGYHNTFSQAFKNMHSKIDWSYTQKNHRVKDADMAYYLSSKSISNNLEIITSWLEILQI